MLSSAEDHAAGGDLLRGAGRGKVLAATQGRCQTVRGDGVHRVGDRETGLLQLGREHTSSYADTHTGFLTAVILTIILAKIITIRNIMLIVSKVWLNSKMAIRHTGIT